MRRRWLLLCLLLGAIAAIGEERPSPKLKTERVQIPDQKVHFTLVQLPAGRISLVCEDGTPKEFEIKSIWIGQTEVTWEEYNVFWMLHDIPEAERSKARGDTKRIDKPRPAVPYLPPDRGWGRDGFPAGSIPCKWAKAYCDWLSQKTGNKYRLPTDAEWEYACRAGGPVDRPDETALKKVAWYADNSDDQTHPVAKKEPNAWGLYDMLGNVAEWVIHLDQKKHEYKEFVAGGSFQDKAADVYPGARAERDRSWEKSDPETPPSTSWFWDGGHVGFRLVRED